MSNQEARIELLWLDIIYRYFPITKLVLNFYISVLGRISSCYPITKFVLTFYYWIERLMLSNHGALCIEFLWLDRLYSCCPIKKLVLKLCSMGNQWGYQTDQCKTSFLAQFYFLRGTFIKILNLRETKGHTPLWWGGRHVTHGLRRYRRCRCFAFVGTQSVYYSKLRGFKIKLYQS